MIIALKLTAAEIGYLKSTLSSSAIVDVAAFARADRNKRLVLSLLSGVAEIFEKKFREVSKDHNLFDATKKYKIKLEYHEAFSVNTVVRERATKEKDSWCKNTANKLYLLIDEKL